MSVWTLVERDALDPYRSRSLWVLLGLFVIVFGAVGALINPQFVALAGLLPTLLVVIVPLGVLAFCYNAIAGPRQSGSLRVLLSYPYSRREVVLGTFLGRTAVLALAVVVGVVTAAVAAVLFSGVVPALVDLAIVLGLAVLFTVAFVATVVGISASVATTTRAAVAAFGAYLLFSGFWGQIPTLVRYVLGGFSFPTGRPPEWTLVWNQLNPLNAYRSATQALVDAPITGSFYHAAWFGLLVLLAWLLVPLVLGILRFERVDL